MKGSMISILTAIVLGLMIQPVMAQGYQGHGKDMHKHMMQMMEDCPMMGDRDMDHSELMAMMEKCPMMQGDKEEDGDSANHDAHH